MIKNISAWKTSSLNEYSVQIRLGSNLGGFFLYTYTIKPPALRVVPHPALALDNKTSNAIISVGPKPHYI